MTPHDLFILINLILIFLLSIPLQILYVWYPLYYWIKKVTLKWRCKHLGHTDW